MATIEKIMFIDTSKCIACKACQVACKQWHSLPAESTVFNGSYQNPPTFSENTLTFIKFKEHVDYYGKLQWLFFKNQCKHCVRPKCQQFHPKGVKRLSNGIVMYNDACTWQNVRLTKQEKIDYPTELTRKPFAIAKFQASCPFRVPKFSVAAQKFVKCDLCYDRVNGGYSSTYREGQPTTACELTCPAGAIITGPVSTISKIAKVRHKVARLNYPEATLYNGGFGRTNVVFLLIENPSNYGLESGAKAL